MKEEEYVIYLLTNYCMPTLWNKKPASLINAFKKQIDKTELFLERLEYQVRLFGCSTFILYENINLINILIVNRGQVSEVLQKKESMNFLSTYGYELSGDAADNMLQTLKLRYVKYNVENQVTAAGEECRKAVYPHEIGLILGYPLYDVKDFINYCGKNYLYCGFWKVYHELDYALQTFESYRIARETALQFVNSGKGLSEIRNIF